MNVEVENHRPLLNVRMGFCRTIMNDFLVGMEGAVASGCVGRAPGSATNVQLFHRASERLSLCRNHSVMKGQSSRSVDNCDARSHLDYDSYDT